MEAILETTREQQERRGKIRTFTGRYVNPLKMRASDICIEDIAHHLSLICRYTGACPRHYSVAQHSVIASYYPLGPQTREHKLARLLHDSGEYVFNDLASPVKQAPQMKFYRDLEHETTKLIFCVFGLDPDLLALTKPADDWVFRREAASWWGAPTALEYVRPWSEKASERGFRKRFEELRE